MDALRALSYFCAGLGVGVLLMLLDDLARMVSRYRQVTRDVDRYRREMLPQAKKDRAYLNGLVKSVDQRRIEAKKAYMQPHDAFEAQVKTLLAHGREASANLDAQIKTLEEQERADNCLDNHAAVVHKLRAADARARHEARTSAWLAQFAADTIRGVNDVFREAIGERRSARITAFQPTAAELLTEAKEATRETR